jgi:putative ABC transport system permease protein
MVLFITDELSYDKYNTKADRIYRVEADIKFGDNEFKMTYRSAPEANALLHEFPEIESTIRFRKMGSYLVKPTDEAENIKELNVIWADSTFFKIFSVPVLEGNSATALAQPASVAISKTMAEKYFPGSNALGKSLILDNKYHATVTAVFEDISRASHFHFDIMVSMVGDWPIAREAKSNSFMSENFNTYLLLKPGADVENLESKLSDFLDKFMGPQVTQSLGSDFTMEKFRASGNRYNLSLRPLKDIHLYANLKGEFEPNGNIVYVYLMSLVAGFILIIGCINFMNLSTARSGSRAKEVGLRKVMGSLRSHLVKQFLIESILITLFSVWVGIALVYLFLPILNSLAQKEIQIPFNSIACYGILLSGSLVIGLMAGLYPSFFLSAFKPIQVLKGQVSLGMKSGTIRSTLVVFQFIISIFLTVGAVSVNRQFQFIQNKKLGFEKDQVIIIKDGYALRPNNVNPFKEEALKLSSIEAGTISGFVPVENDWVWRSNNSFWLEGSDPSPDNLISSQEWAVDYDYIKTFQMKMKMGRAFSESFPSDQNAIILNETAAKRLGISTDPIGKKVNLFNGPADPENIRSYEVIGIIDDFHFTSLKENISALGLRLGKSDGSISFRYKPKQAKETIQTHEKNWNTLANGKKKQNKKKK